MGWAALLVMLAGLLVVAVEWGRERGAMRRSFPQLEGRLAVIGLGAPLTLLRDGRGVPHVEARNEEDAYFGLGFAHAQDRLAQMQWLLRLARGRLSEVRGPEGLAADRLARTLDLAGVAEEEAARLEGATRRRLAAYVRGVNARIARVRAGEAGPPRALALPAAELEEWSPADSLAVLKYYAWALSASLDASLVLEDLLRSLGGVRARRFFPDSGGDGAERPAVTAEWSPRHWVDPLRAAMGLAGRTAGSSAWVVGGAHSSSGLPLLVADSHVEPTAPALLHVAHIRGGELDVAGSSVPGIPIFWTGHNRRVAWASSHAGAAVTDLYEEKLDSDAARYHDGGGWRPLEVRDETLGVRGEAPQTLTVRSTRHGPLVEGLLEAANVPLAVTWVGMGARGGDTLAAFHAVARSADSAALLGGLASHSEPALAVVYADADGNAGLQVAGWIPQRTLPTRLVTVPGRASWYDWDGRIPFEQLPARRLQEGRGWLVAADNRFTARGDDPAGEWLWRSGVRARRIEARLREAVEAGPLDLLTAAELLNDVGEPRALELVEAALRLVHDGATAPGNEVREVVELLRGWDGVSTPESVGAAAFHVFLVQLAEALFREPMGEELAARYLALPQADPGAVIADIVRDADAGGEAGGWSDPQRVAAAVNESLRETWFQLSYALGASRSKWRWGRLHRIGFRPFGAGVPGAALGPFEAAGSDATVLAAEYAFGEPYAVQLASTFRFAADAGALDRSLVALAPGESEHPGHAHYDDGLPGWLDGRTALLVTGRLLLEDAAAARLELEPAP